MTMPPWIIDGIGFAAAAGTTFSLLPQLVRIRKRKTATDLSLGMFAVFSLGVFLWLVYGILAHSRPVILANAVTLLFSLAIIALKLHYDRVHPDKDRDLEHPHQQTPEVKE